MTPDTDQAVNSLIDAASLIRSEGSFAGLAAPPAELGDWLDR